MPLDNTDQPYGTNAINRLDAINGNEHNIDPYSAQGQGFSLTRTRGSTNLLDDLLLDNLTESRLDPDRLPLQNMVKKLPFICLLCETKIEHLRDLVRIDCVCCVPYYHYFCLPPLPLHHCRTCLRKSLPLRGARALWDQYSYAEWKNYLEQSCPNPENRKYIWQLRQSLLKDWPHGVSNLPRVVAKRQLIIPFWQKSHQRSIDPIQPNFIDLRNRLEECLHLWPLKSINLLVPDATDSKVEDFTFPAVLELQVRSHSEFMEQLKIWSTGIFHEDFDWQGIYLEGEFIWSILYGIRKGELPGPLTIHILKIEKEDNSSPPSQLNILLRFLKNIESMGNRGNISTLARACRLIFKGRNKIQLFIQGWNQQIDIIIHGTEDVRQLLVKERPSSTFFAPWREGLLVNHTGILASMQWFDSMITRTVVTKASAGGVEENTGNENEKPGDNKEGDSSHSIQAQINEIIRRGFIPEVDKPLTIKNASPGISSTSYSFKTVELDLVNFEDTIKKLTRTRTTTKTTTKTKTTDNTVNPEDLKKSHLYSPQIFPTNLSNPNFWSWTVSDKVHGSFGHLPNPKYLGSQIGKIRQSNKYRETANPYLPPNMR